MGCPNIKLFLRLNDNKMLLCAKMLRCDVKKVMNQGGVRDLSRKAIVDGPCPSEVLG